MLTKKLKNKVKSNESGFTLVEVMIVAAILSVLMVAFASYMYQNAKNNQNLQNNAAAQQLANEVVNVAGQFDSISNTEELEVP